MKNMTIQNGIIRWETDEGKPHSIIAQGRARWFHHSMKFVTLVYLDNLDSDEDCRILLENGWTEIDSVWSDQHGKFVP